MLFPYTVPYHCSLNPFLSPCRNSGGGGLPARTNGLPAAAHMLGNQLNPASLMAPKLSDSLAAELAEQAGYLEPPGRLVGPPLPGRPAAASAGAAPLPSRPGAPPFPQSLSELLERQWEQGSHFLMEQSQHFDVAALLSCLYQLRQENEQLEEHMSELSQRRDHLLAVNARLSQPLESAPPLPTAARPPSSVAAAAVARAHYGSVGPLGHHSGSPRPPLENGVGDGGGRPAPPSPLQLHSPLGGGGRPPVGRQPPPASPLGSSRRSPTVRSA
ncbi:uncharacterized protein FJT64_020829 [Amphibalanus amphitrite]|uniref:Uncharacterized protein n=1 Tax=Amphibalanus amphitrite TaxID=1232801 RepID=A0A6A4X0Q0_AMPAM|nr:uncharacterized protein FJT64_020829 [Amphibalanus amphitrite]